MPANTLFTWSSGELDLIRFPLPRDYSLQAFSSADAYLLDHVAEYFPDAKMPWVINDDFGALSLALLPRQPLWIGSSWSARHALEENAKRNNLDAPKCHWLDDSPWPANPGLIVISLPKELDLLEYQLSRINDCAPVGIPVVACGMTRNIHTSTIRLFETYLADVSSSLAWKKARLIKGTTMASRTQMHSSETSYLDPRSGATVISHAGVFSAEHPDPGSSLLAHSVPEFDKGSKVLDIGCGNGYLLAVIGLKNHGVDLLGCDDSRMAVISTMQTLATNGLTGDIRHGHATADFPESTVDTVICNPPFHQGHARHDQIAWEMFVGAKKVLKPGGTIYVVGNRNLGYHIQLSRLFRSADVQASDNTYTVFKCKKGTY